MLHQFQSMATGEEVYNLLQRETEALEYDYYTLCVRHPVPFTRPRVTFQSTYPPRMDVALSGRKLFRDRSCVTAGEFYAWPSAMERQPVS